MSTKRLVIFCLICLLISCKTNEDPAEKTAAPAGSHFAATHHGNLWSDLRRDFKLPEQTNLPAVQKQIHWFIKNEHYFNKLAARAAPYLYYVHQEVKKHGLPGEIALLPMIESGYNPFAYSRAGAAGLWQIMPGTGTGFGLKQNWWYDGRRDIHASTKAALDYLGYLHHFFDEHWLLAIAAYDSGEGTVERALVKNAKLGKSTVFWQLQLPHETRDYVPRLLALAAIIRHPERYPIHLPKIENEPYFAKVALDSQINLNQAAKLAELPLTELYQLNPGYNHWATAPNGPFTLVLPIDKIDTFKANLAELPREKRVSWQRHTVKRGDTLSHIAKHYDSTVKSIKVINKLSDNQIHVGKTLLIPKTREPLHLDKTLLKRHAAIINHKQVGPQKMIHTVKPGDSLIKISRHYHIKPAAIRFWNHLNSNTKLKTNQQLILWVSLSRFRQLDKTKRYYQIHPGDTLSHIAKRFKIKLKHLVHKNPNIDPNRLHPGQKILI